MIVEIEENLESIGGSIFEAKSAFTAWKAIVYSRSSNIVTEELAKKYVNAQKTAVSFFVIAERSFLATFILLSLHPIDKDSRSFSFFKIDEGKTKKFIIENKSVIDRLMLVRNKVFAHKDSDVTKYTIESYAIPSLQELEDFFDNLTKFYNELTGFYKDSFTDFENGNNHLLNEMDYMFMNLTRGENARIQEIDIEMMWLKDRNIIAKTLRGKNSQ